MHISLVERYQDSSIRLFSDDNQNSIFAIAKTSFLRIFKKEVLHLYFFREYLIFRAFFIEYAHSIDYSTYGFFSRS